MIEKITGLIEKKNNAAKIYLVSDLVCVRTLHRSDGLPKARYMRNCAHF